APLATLGMIGAAGAFVRTVPLNAPLPIYSVLGVYTGGSSDTSPLSIALPTAFAALCGSLGTAGQDAVVSAWVHGLGLERDELPLSRQGKAAAQAGDILAVHVALEAGGARAFYGRTIDGTAGRGVLLTSAMQSA
ncbi:MAG: hypothetical protein ABSH03_14080, partial [Candidatus Lustribacter sp.]